MKISLTQPDDFHLHLRDGSILKDLVPFTARQFKRAIVMPNLIPAITTVGQALAYRQRILEAIPEGSTFDPLMTLYLTENMDVSEVEAIKSSQHIKAVKLYPAGATTNSSAGVRGIKNCSSVLEALQKHKIPLLVHGEVVNPEVDVFDREKVFIDEVLQPVRKQFPELKIVFEHITTEDAASFVLSESQIAATITPQHLLYNRNVIFQGGIRPHYYCLPVLKREQHRQALIKAAISGNNKFFLGTDSAPHTQTKKENACGCAGIFSAPLAVELYARIFEENNAIEKLEGFSSFYGADFYGLPRNTEKITLEKKEWTVPKSYPLDGERIIPLHAGQIESWQLV